MTTFKDEGNCKVSIDVTRFNLDQNIPPQEVDSHNKDKDSDYADYIDLDSGEEFDSEDDSSAEEGRLFVNGIPFHGDLDDLSMWVCKEFNRGNNLFNL